MASSGFPSRLPGIVALALVLMAMLPVPAVAITREAVIARAERWVDLAVPYSQSRYATVEGSLIPAGTPYPSRRGYRTDCSGFVSMCFGFRTASGLPLSLSTASLDDVMVEITKDELRRGDVVLRPNDLVIDGKRVAYGHAVIFAGWVDEARTRYVGYHQSSSRKGAVRAEIDWGTSGFRNEPGYAPYRSPLATDRTKIGAGTAP